MARYGANKIERFPIRGKSGTIISPGDYTKCEDGTRYELVRAVRLPGKKEDEEDVSTIALFRVVPEY